MDFVVSRCCILTNTQVYCDRGIIARNHFSKYRRSGDCITRPRIQKQRWPFATKFNPVKTNYESVLSERLRDFTPSDNFIISIEVYTLHNSGIGFVNKPE